MNEYELLGGLHEILDEDIDQKIDKWLDSHNANYWLLYPLAMVELGVMNEAPEKTSNLFKRCVTSFVYAKAITHGKDMYIKKFNISGLKKYMKEYESTLLPLFQNYRFSREINDINPVSKAKLNQVGEHRYQLTTSLVTDKYSEENFYFYGEDNPEKNIEEKKQTMNLHVLFWNKIVMSQTTIGQLESVVDKVLYDECIKIVEKDLNKWDARVKSRIFDNPKQIAAVIAFFYYYAMIRSICIRIVTLEGEQYIDNADECIMMFDKAKCIHDIAELGHLREDKVKTIVDYFVNTGNANLLEFPLFEVENKLISIPSLFIVNDWQFTVVNGHYIKDISIRNREKTISVVTEGRIEKLMCGIENVAIAKTIPYSYVDADGKIQNSDVDFAILDQKRNVAVIIEAKWIDKHYGDEIDKRYGKILETLNSIYKKQISKHQEFLSLSENIDFLFEKDTRYIHNDTMPKLYYLAVDKRNQMHIGERHMVSEYMLLYFLKKHCVDRQLNIEEFWNEINELQTKFEYIPVSSEFYEIPVGEDTILVEECDLYWDK
ncbi:MAG: hypothetical protein PHG16_07530 [Lachnospiraceae bacterium]|nr:hypothetical protein [Lachnospiraceae bacterium]